VNDRIYRKAFRHAWLVVAAFAVCLLVPFAGTAAAPADVVCSQDTEFFTGTARNLIVAEHSFCFVLDATITNDLIVGDFARAVVLDTAIGRDLAANDEAEAEVALGTTIGRDLVLRGPGGGVRLEETTIGRDLVASKPGSVQTGHNRPISPGGPVHVGRDVAIDGSPELEFVFDGICDLHVARDLRITNRSVKLGIGVGNTCAANGLPSNTIGRDLVFTGNHALDGFFGPSSLTVGDNDVGRDLVFAHNTAVTGGSLEVSGNAVVRDATCAANSPAVTVGAVNTAGRENNCG
jgi:hypothetical protein